MRRGKVDERKVKKEKWIYWQGKIGVNGRDAEVWMGEDKRRRRKGRKWRNLTHKRAWEGRRGRKNIWPFL